jgi:hypothetical protein
MLKVKSSGSGALDLSQLHTAFFTSFKVISLSNQTEESILKDLKHVLRIYILRAMSILNRLEKTFTT